MIALQPAYGRKYKSEKDARKDWLNGKDFKVISGPYTSIRDRAYLLSHHGEIRIYWSFDQLGRVFEG